MDVGAATETPAFLLWAIEFGCPVRSFEDGTIPDRVERQLRSAREVGLARREGRVFEGLALAPPNGFRVEEALAIYGGEAAVETNCRGCPANALSQGDPHSLAGCYGCVPLPLAATGVYEAIDAAMEATCGVRHWSTEAGEIRPCWFGMWQQPLWAEQLLVAFRVLEAAQIADAPCRQALDELMLGLNAAYSANRSLYARLFPAGRVVENNWQLVTHCPQCSAAWGDKAARRCGVCGYAGSPAPDKKRLPRGQRPYFPLERLLGREQAEALLVRYAAFRVPPESLGRPQNQPEPVPPGSPPAG